MPHCCNVIYERDAFRMQRKKVCTCKSRRHTEKLDTHIHTNLRLLSINLRPRHQSKVSPPLECDRVAPLRWVTHITVNVLHAHVLLYVDMLMSLGSNCSSGVTAPFATRPTLKRQEKEQSRIAPLDHKQSVRSATAAAVMAGTLWCSPPALLPRRKSRARPGRVAPPHCSLG